MSIIPLVRRAPPRSTGREISARVFPERSRRPRRSVSRSTARGNKRRRRNRTTERARHRGPVMVPPGGRGEAEPHVPAVRRAGHAVTPGRAFGGRRTRRSARRRRRGSGRRDPAGVADPPSMPEASIGFSVAGARLLALGALEPGACSRPARAAALAQGVAARRRSPGGSGCGTRG